jgi:hypothetical protein
MTGRDQNSSQGGSDFEREMRARHEIPLFSAVCLFEKFQKSVAELLRHPNVVASVETVSRLLSTDSSVTAKSNDIGPIKSPTNSPTRKVEATSFGKKMVKAMEEKESPIAPEKLKDEHGRRLDATRNVGLMDIRTAVLRVALHGAIEQLFLTPKSDTADTLLVEKMLALVSEKSEDTLRPRLIAFIGAFAEVVSSPHFAGPTQLTDAQRLLMRAVFGAVDSGPNAPVSILAATIIQAGGVSRCCRNYFVIGQYANHLPQALLNCPISRDEKQGLALTRALYHIQLNLLPNTLDAGSSDLSNSTFTDPRAAWAKPFISREAANLLRGYLCEDFTEKMVHRTHNLGMDKLQYFGNALAEAFKRENQPRVIWPDANYQGGLS